MNRIETHRFSNGLNLILERVPGSQSFGVAVGFPAGGRTEAAKVSGISHYLEHMIFKGTRTVRNIDKTFERVGANTNAVTEIDSTVYFAECPRENAFKTLKLWLRFLSEAAIDREEFERERGVIISEYFITEDNPDFLVDKNSALALFKGHPLASTVIGSESTIKAISHRDMLEYFRFWYHPSNGVIWVSGDLKMEKLVNAVEQQKDWQERGVTPGFSYKAFKPKGPCVVELPRKIKLAQIGLALSSPTDSPEQRASLQVLSSMLSAGQSSLLRRRLILEREFTDRLRVGASSYREAGVLFTTFATQPSKAFEVLSILTKTVRDLRQSASRFREEFENARSHAVGSFSTSIDRGMMWRAIQGAWETLRRGHCSWDELISSLDSLSFEHFKDNLAEMTQSERTALVVAGDIEKGVTDKLQW